MLSPVLYGWLEETHTCTFHILQIESLHFKDSYFFITDPAKLQSAEVNSKHALLGVAHWEQMEPWWTDGPRAGNFQELFVGGGIPSFTSKACPKGTVKTFSLSVFLIPIKIPLNCHRVSVARLTS